MTNTEQPGLDAGARYLDIYGAGLPLLAEDGSPFATGWNACITEIRRLSMSTPKPTDEFARGVEDAQEIDVLERAYDWIKSAPHADECFTNDPNPDACCCVCGKDAMLEYLADPSSAPAPDTVGVPGGALKKLYSALTVAVMHVDHMAAWIGKHNAGVKQGLYTFESLGEDMPGIRALLATPLQLDEDRKSDDLLAAAWLDREYLLGARAGWNAALIPDPDKSEAAYQAIKDGRQGALKVIVENIPSALSKRAGERPKTKKVETDEEARERMMRGDLR